MSLGLRFSIVALLLAALFAFECRLAALSPHEEVKPSSTTEIEAGDGSTTTVFNFQSVAAKGGWFVTPLTLLGWIVATIKTRRRERAADEMIDAIESCGDEAVLVKSQVQRKANPWIEQRVKKLAKLKTGK
jgi:hypothetical protein